jgi:hypothetical protein
MTTTLDGVSTAAPARFFGALLAPSVDSSAAASGSQLGLTLEALRIPAEQVQARLESAKLPALHGLRIELDREIAAQLRQQERHAANAADLQPGTMGADAAQAHVRAARIRTVELQSLLHCVIARLSDVPEARKQFIIDAKMGVLDFLRLQSHVAGLHANWLQERADKAGTDAPASEAGTSTSISEELRQTVLRTEHGTLVRVQAEAETAMLQSWERLQVDPTDTTALSQCVAMLDAVRLLHGFSASYAAAPGFDTDQTVTVRPFAGDLQQAAAQSYARARLGDWLASPEFGLRLRSSIIAALQEHPGNAVLGCVADDLEQLFARAHAHYADAVAAVCHGGSDHSPLATLARARVLATEGEHLPQHQMVAAESGFRRAAAAMEQGDQSLQWATDLLQRAQSELADLPGAATQNLRQELATGANILRLSEDTSQPISSLDARLPAAALAHQLAAYSAQHADRPHDEALAGMVENLLAGAGGDRFFVDPNPASYFSVPAYSVLP